MIEISAFSLRFKYKIEIRDRHLVNIKTLGKTFEMNFLLLEISVKKEHQIKNKMGGTNIILHLMEFNLSQKTLQALKCYQNQTFEKCGNLSSFHRFAHCARF